MESALAFAVIRICYIYNKFIIKIIEIFFNIHANFIPLKLLGGLGTFVSSKSFSYVSIFVHSVQGPVPLTLKAHIRT